MSYADRVERIQPSLTLKINAEAAAIQADHRGGDAVAPRRRPHGDGRATGSSVLGGSSSKVETERMY